MKTIRKKCWPNYFESIRTGVKVFEVRIADFDCEVGDTLILEEWDPDTQQYTGRLLSKRITYLIKTKEHSFFQKRDIERFGYLIMSLECSKEKVTDLEDTLELCKIASRAKEGKIAELEVIMDAKQAFIDMISKGSSELEARVARSQELANSVAEELRKLTDVPMDHNQILAVHAHVLIHLEKRLKGEK